MTQIAQVANRLRREGFKPYYDNGKLIDWRRIKKHKLQRVEVNVHPSGRVTVHHRSSDA